VLSGNPLVLKKDISGRAVVDSLVASQIAGRYIVTASLAAASAIRDTVNLTVAVPGLGLLPESQNYVKIGGTCEHHGPSDKLPGDDPCQTPDHNHYGDPQIVGFLPLIAQSYISEFHPQYAIKYNDISLPYGGAFDVAKGWEADLRPHAAGHQLHREGKSVDVRTNPFHQDGVPIGRRQRLQDIVREFDPNATIEIDSPNSGNQHFHIEFILR
jgi:hypothetical protein